MDLSRQFAHLSRHCVKLFLHKLNCLDSVQIRLDSKQVCLVIDLFSVFRSFVPILLYFISIYVGLLRQCTSCSWQWTDFCQHVVDCFGNVQICLHLSQKYFGLSWKFAVLSRLFVKLSRQFADLSWHMMDFLDCVQISFDSVRLSRHIQDCLKIVRI